MQETNIENANILIHIGCHKTASTWFQDVVFDNQSLGFKALHVSSSEHTSSRWRLKSVSTQLIKGKNKQFLGPLTSPKNTFLNDFSERKFLSNQTYIVSDERLSGNPHSGGFDRVTNCLKLKEILPKAKVFVVFRAQETMIRSCYHQFIVAGGSLSLSGYMGMKYNSILPSFSLDYFYYDQLLQLYQEHFGANNVLALPYEMFVQSPEIFLNKIQNFAGPGTDLSEVDFKNKINSRQNPWLLVKLRMLNRLMRQASFFNIASSRNSLAHSLSRAPLLKRFKSRYLLDAQKKRELAFIASETEGFYTQSNKTLEKLTGIPLQPYGYK